MGRSKRRCGLPGLIIAINQEPGEMDEMRAATLWAPEGFVGGVSGHVSAFQVLASPDVHKTNTEFRRLVYVQR